jgi:hypothetical protein
MKRLFVLFILLFTAALFAQNDMSNMPGMKTTDQHSTDMNTSDDEMSHMHMDAGPHMKMTALRDVRPGDEARADDIVRQLRSAIEKYQDVDVARRDGFQEFAPNVPSPMRHFTNYRYAFAAAFKFDPTQPTSLLYEKKDGQYRLIGAMFTAPKRLAEEDLDARVPLSVAQWHAHVNLCLPPKGEERTMYEKNAKFGLRGSIATEEACSAAGGRWMPQVFGWMVHIYPWETTRAAQWSVQRQLNSQKHVD